jgi:pimeloyl-ACP methyl ester carboxylesterase
MFALVSVLTASVALAEDRSVVFVHGLASDGSTWDGAVARLTPRLAMRPYQPTLDWRGYYENQASLIDQQFPGLPNDTVAVGHSNGGVVARQWSRNHPLGALITVGSPNQGAPIVDHIFEWSAFVDDLLNRITNVKQVFTYRVNNDTWWWLPAQWSEKFAFGLDAWSTARNGLISLGLDYRLPVMQQMRVGSGYMANLNGPANRDREFNEVGDRTALVYVARDFNVGGPFRTIKPDSYGTWHNSILITGIGLDALAAVIRAVAEGDDIAAFDLADQISVAAEWFLEFEEVWCRSVSDPSPLPVARCREHDGIVPAWSQAYDFPRVPLIVLQDGPVHTKETQQSDEPLYLALTTTARVQPGQGILPGTGTTPPASGGRYKLDGDRCVWNPYEVGPNQCTPASAPPGRFKFDGWGTCYWEANDFPPDQCTPPPAIAGRYKLDGRGACYWDAQDSGPAQCVP